MVMIDQPNIYSLAKNNPSFDNWVLGTHGNLGKILYTG